MRHEGLITAVVLALVATAIEFGIPTPAWPAPTDVAPPAVASAPTKLLKHASQLKAVMRQPAFIAQLLLNFKTALDRDFLLEPNFYSDDVLKELVGGSPPTWRETTQAREGKRIQTRIGTINVPKADIPQMTIVVEETVITPVGQEIVHQGARPPDQKVSGSITVETASTPDICVCDVRDWFGLETRIRVAPVSAAKALLVYEFPATAPAGSAPAQKSVEFMIRSDGPAVGTPGNSPASEPLIRGHDLVWKFTVKEADE